MVNKGWEIVNGDCLEVLPILPENSFDTVITDPPYHLTAKSRGGSPRKNDHNTPFGRHRLQSKGFMGKQWDGGDIAFRKETWEAVLRVVKPGAYLLAFGGTRTYHRMACAVEDAGWDIKDSLLWIYGSGYPKSHNFGKALEGWKGYGTALKPAHENIVLAMKPFKGTYAENAIEYCTSGLNIDGCRIGLGKGGSREGELTKEKMYKKKGATNFAVKPGPRGGDARGRWPANTLLDEWAAMVLDSQTGVLKSGHADVLQRHTDKHRNTYGNFKGRPAEGATYGDEGGASRFFYCAKASKSERGAYNDHATVKPLSLVSWLCRLTRPPSGGKVLDPFMGSGTTLLAALKEGRECVGIEVDPHYCEIARRRVSDNERTV